MLIQPQRGAGSAIANGRLIHLSANGGGKRADRGNPLATKSRFDVTAITAIAEAPAYPQEFRMPSEVSIAGGHRTEQKKREGIMDPLALSVIVGAIVIGIAVAAVVFINKYAE
jgi:multisubunit Na+/H+ antiporter MnhC subunit